MFGMPRQLERNSWECNSLGHGFSALRCGEVRKAAQEKCHSAPWTHPYNLAVTFAQLAINLILVVPFLAGVCAVVMAIRAVVKGEVAMIRFFTTAHMATTAPIRIEGFVDSSKFGADLVNGGIGARHTLSMVCHRVSLPRCAHAYTLAKHDFRGRL